jgi:hypothetical protein
MPIVMTTSAFDGQFPAEVYPGILSAIAGGNPSSCAPTTTAWIAECQWRSDSDDRSDCSPPRVR